MKHKQKENRSFNYSWVNWHSFQSNNLSLVLQIINTEISSACSYVYFHIHLSMYVSIQVANLIYAQN